MSDQIILQITGMTCNSCVHSIQQKISVTDGVKSIKVSLANKSAEVEYNKDIISDSALIEAIEEMGFEASPMPKESNLARSTFTVKGLENDSCVHQIESKFQSHPGVKSIKVSLEEKLIRVIHISRKLPVSDICKLVSELGYPTEIISLKDLSNSLVKINVEGMTCHSCVNNIEDFVGKKPGVSKIKVSLKDKLASIWFDPIVVNPEELRTVIEDMGFDTTLSKTTPNTVKCSAFEIQSLGISDWSLEDEDVLFNSKGIFSIKSTSSPTDRIVYYFQSVLGVNDIINIIQSMGFICSEKSVDVVDKGLPVKSVQQHYGSNEKDY